MNNYYLTMQIYKPMVWKDDKNDLNDRDKYDQVLY